MLTYSIQLNAYGSIRFKTTVPACEAGIVGDYHQSKPYQPDYDATLAAMPFKYRKAFIRAGKWWQEQFMSGRLLPLKCDLYSLKGKPMGTLYATPLWPAI